LKTDVNKMTSFKGMYIHVYPQVPVTNYLYTHYTTNRVKSVITPTFR